MKKLNQTVMVWRFQKMYLKASLLLMLMCISSIAFAQVNTGGSATTSNHQKQVIGYITNWDAWKTNTAGVPSAGALTHLNIDYSKYTILNYSFFGVARDGSLHSGDHRDKKIHQAGVTQAPKDIFFTDIYSSWDMHILFGEIDPIQYINEDAKRRAEAQGFQVALQGSTWTHPTWGLSGSLPLPLHKETGAPGLLELAHQKGVKVMASIGGWSMCKHFPEMAADPVKRAKFIEDCKKLIATGFDGIDLDWEYPGPFAGMNFTGTQADFANFETLLQELRTAIGPTKLITSAMSADPRKLDGFNWTNVASNMDYFNMMTYDFNGGWSNIAGHNAPVYPYTGAEVPFFNWQSTLQKLVELGVPKNKICFGAPFYGRGVITEGNADLNVKTVKRSENIQPDGPIETCADYTNWPKNVYDGTPNHFFIKQKALSPNSGWTRKWDNEAKVPYLVNGKYFLSYDDEESIAVKAKFINDNGLAGTIVWTVYGDLEIGGSVTSFGPKLKRWSNVKSPLVNKINEVFATGGPGGNVAPVVNITSPANNANFAVGATIAITANASDSDGTVTKVEFYNGPVKLGEDTTSPYEFSWQNVAEGSYTLTAKVTDNENATGNSAAVSITVGNGPPNVPPTVSITSPNNNDTFIAGASIAITADAQDIDGAVSKVEFYNGPTKLGEDTTSPFSFTITNAAVGEYALTAKATDNENASTTSSVVSITVNSDTGGGCANIPQYVAGTSYGQDDEVQNVDQKFKCNVPGWCSSNAAWAYAPGTGAHWEQAWSKIGDCGGTNPNVSPTVNITSPANNSTFQEGTAISIAANAADSDGTVAKVEFYNGPTKLGEDTTSPYEYVWQNAAVGNYVLTAKATDNLGASTTSSAVNISVNGVNNDPPSVSITSPANNSSFDEGASISITASASDTDGTITMVEFFNNGAKIGQSASSPYSYTITNAAVGNYVLTAKATDNGSATSTSSAVSVSVTAIGGGNCNGLPQYVAGTSYSQNEEVQNVDQKFKCNIPGWCSSAAAWAYAPGTGAHWQDAWSKIGDCGGGPGGNAPVVNITSPANGATYTAGNSVTITANATDDGTVSKVEFFNGTTKLGEDTTSPYSYTITNAQAASYSLTAIATDNEANQTTSEAVTVRKKVDGGNNNLPSKILVGYWHNFNNGSTTPRLSEVSRDWDVICVAFAEPRAGSTSDMQFSPYEIYAGNTQAFIDDVATVRSRGQKVLISIGGANARVELGNETEKNEFISSMTNIINTYGFDGLDIDLEGSSLSLASGDTDFRSPTTPKIVNLIAATKAVRTKIGANRFILSMAPETAYVQGAYGNYSGIFGAYLPVIHALRDEMNYIHVQHYNTGSMFGRDGQVYQPATADFHVAMAEMLITGFPVAQTGLTFPGLRADQVAIGLPSSTQAAGSGYTSEAVVQQALDYLIKGVSYPGRSYTTSATYPSFRGLMTWSINWDLVNTSRFSSSHRAYLDGLGAPAVANRSSEVGKVFPNPLSGNMINVALDGNLSKSTGSDYFRFQIFNTNGIKVYDFQNNNLQRGEDVKSFDIGDLESGMYFYTISVSKNKTTGKIIKE
ncbi:Ig-like domain-containing protein [Aquimarina sediminis]|uniref:Ig-like domain-containing protein n=1 Tax=Aquimarina sediminis TaxID=2070536 RepID=UPI000CA05D15|nr:Ig-like domain-containing protein [Aquimarina sediminis]